MLGKIKSRILNIQIKLKERLSKMASKREKLSDSVAIITGGGLGDGVLMLPYVKAVKEYYEKAGKKVILIADTTTSELMKRFANFETVLTYKRFDTKKELKAVIGYNVKLIRRYRYDIAVNFCHHFTHLANRSVVKNVIAKEFIGSNASLQTPDDEIKKYYSKILYNETENQINIYYKFALDLGVNCTQEMFYLKSFVKDCEYMGRVVICVGSSSDNRKWGVEKWRALVSFLLENYPNDIVFCGSKKEGLIADDVMAAFSGNNRLTNLCGKTDMQDMVNVLGNSAFVIAQDSGPAHIACSVGAKGVVILGGGMKHLFFPHVGVNGETTFMQAVYNEEDCWGCWWNCTRFNDKEGLYNKESGNYYLNKKVPCIEGITVEQVADAVKRYFK